MLSNVLGTSCYVRTGNLKKVPDSSLDGYLEAIILEVVFETLEMDKITSGEPKGRSKKERILGHTKELRDLRLRT